ncbi:chemotaxis protein CheC [Paenibacillus yanchengensis]|uniref:Chemotaxis protein CheC n=1 Tax=Paenibacillus yanchengensis TaxID=2035833 RepID=A0ABW4YMN2_9BACL
MDILSRLEAFEFDVLKEVGNIGSGNAATALSTLLNKPIDMAVPEVSLLPFEQVAEQVGGAEEVVVAIFLRVEGDAPGNMFYIMDDETARRLLDHLLPTTEEQSLSYTELELSTLCEISNILAGSYLSSLADFTKLTLQPSVPVIAYDMAGAILNYGLMQYGEMGDSALLIETAFLEGYQALNGQFFFIPDPLSFEKIFHALGVGFG